MRQTVDHYAVLSVRRTDDHQTIKKAYRRLARQYHPDHNQGDVAAEEQFKRVVAAWNVLGDPVRRRQYDLFGSDAVLVTHIPTGADVLDLMKDAAQRAKTAFQYQFLRKKGNDLHITVSLSLKEALLGTTRVLEIPRQNARNQIERRRFEIEIPPGVGVDKHLRWKGYGAPGSYGGAYGDLIVFVTIEPHPIFRFEGDQLCVDLYLSQNQAMEREPIVVPTPWGIQHVSIATQDLDKGWVELSRMGGLNKARNRTALRAVLHVERLQWEATQRQQFYTRKANYDRYVQELQHGAFR